MTSWTKQQFGDFYEVPSRNGIYKSKEFHGAGYRIVNMGELFAFNFIGDQPMKRVVLSDSEIKINGLQEGDLLFGRRSLIESGAGKCSIVVKTKEELTFESSIIRVRLNRKIANPFFLYYFFSSSIGKGIIHSIVSGTNVKGIRGSDLERLVISIPELQGQNILAEVFQGYNALIENNEKRIKILEEMCQRLYTEWFVKFKFPGYEKVKMVNSPLGKIPEGWEVVPMSEIANFVNGYPFKPAELGDSGLPIVKIPELRSGIVDKTPRNNGDNIPKKYLIKNGDILFSWSATLLVNIWNSGDALLNQHLFKVEPKQKIHKSYVYYALKILVKNLSKHVVGSTMQHLRRGTVVDAKILLPNSIILEHYEEFASIFVQEIGNLQIQNQVLQKTRDILIPQLVTGRRELKNV